MGYTPLYDTTLTGTLYGRWPHTGIWACLLSRQTREGVIDEVPASLAAAIGVPVELLMQCIHDFMQPDPGSRTKDHDGRRLVLIDPDRDWGWRVVNYRKYREKARKQNSDRERTETGDNAARMRDRKLRDLDPRRPAKTRADPPSDTDTNTDKRGAPRSCRVPRGFTPDLSYAVAQLPDIDAEAEAQKFKDCEFKKARSDWEATWRTWIRTCKDSGRYSRKEQAKWM